MERGWREISPNCPRCGSSNTKFCYYNNYSLTQPRYFCKGCRRYWTKGGSLRNVPVGGGCRKSRRSRSSSLRLATSSNHHHSLHPSKNSTIYGHGDHVGATNTNSQYGPSSYGNNGMVESTPSSMNPEVPNIDLAVVYANYLNQKPENNNDGVVAKLPEMISSGFENNPPVEFPTIPDATHIGPSSQVVLQQEHTNVMDCTNNPPFSQGLSLPLLSSDNNHNQMFLSEFSRPMHQHEEISIQHELGLPPLPGESSSWAPSSDNHHNLQVPRVLDLEPDSHEFSNLFIGNWSPIDLPGFETSSSSSKP